MQIDQNVISLIISVLTIIIAVYVVWQAKKVGTPITNTLLTTTLKNAGSTATDITEVALTAVKAAEQLYRTGRMERNARLSFAVSYLRKWFPSLSEDVLVISVEAAVLVVNGIVAMLPNDDKETQQ